MSANTKIEWATKTWNPLRGCSKVSEGCRNCYAIRVAHRFGGEGQAFEGLTTTGAGVPNWTGKVTLVHKALDEPLRWKKPERIFVNSMSDLFHPEVPFEFIRAVYARMAAASHHTFMVLTKRPERAIEFFQWMSEQEFRVEESLPNMWLGVSVENQKAADERIPLLLQTPAAIRFLSCEPLLGPVDLTTEWLSTKNDGQYPFPKLHPRHRTSLIDLIDWVITGGESGPGARPVHPDWIRSLRDQCQAAGVPFFFKQWGGFAPYVDDDKFTHCGEETDRNKQYYVNPDGSHGVCWLVDGDGTWQNWTGDPQETCWVVNRVGKKAAGRMLDGRTWDEFPQSST